MRMAQDRELAHGPVAQEELRTVGVGPRVGH